MVIVRCECDNVSVLMCDGVKHLSVELAASFRPSGDQQHLNKFCDSQ